MAQLVGGPWRGERRARILDAAARVLARGPQASMDEIAREAGCGKPTVYRYFDSKDALLAAVFVAALDDLERRLARAMRTETTLEARLVALTTEILPLFRDHLVAARFLEETASAGESKRRIFCDRRSRIAAFLALAIDSGVARGEIREVDSMTIAQLMIGMMWSAASADSGANLSALAHDVTEFSINGLARREVDTVPAGAGPFRGARAAISHPVNL